MAFETFAELKQHLYFVHRDDHPLILSSHGFPQVPVQNPDLYTVVTIVTYRRVKERMQEHINNGNDDLNTLFKMERMNNDHETVLKESVKEEIYKDYNEYLQNLRDDHEMDDGDYRTTASYAM